jgi:PTS system mannose-specific IIA component
VIGIVIAAHAQLAESLKQAASSVLGTLGNVSAITIEPHDSAADIHEKFQVAIQQVRLPGGVLILTDMFGGTPANIGLTLHDGKHVEILTGVNLPMVIKAAQLAIGDISLDQAAEAVRKVGVGSITIASQLLSGTSGAAKRENDG